MALLLGGVLDRLGQHGGIARSHHFRPRLLQRVEDARDGMVGIERDPLARQLRQCGLKLVT